MSSGKRRRHNNIKEEFPENKNIAISNDGFHGKDTDVVMQNNAINESSIKSEVNNYEDVREENIKRNTEFLQTLGLDDIKLKIEASMPRKASTRGKSSSRNLTNVLPSRRSSRVTTERLKVEIEEAKQRGDTEMVVAKMTDLKELEQNKYENTFESVIAQYNEITTRFDNSPIPMNPPINEPEDEDRVVEESKVLTHWGMPIINTFRAFPTSTPKKQSASNILPFINTYKNSITNLRLNESDVAKLVKERIVSSFIHPSSSKLIVAAGDKSGFVGLWDVDNLIDGKDGVFMYRPHVSNVCLLHCSSLDQQKLWSVSYDGTVRYMDIQQEAFVLGYEAEESINDIYFSDACFSSTDINTALIGRSDGQVQLVDFRSSSSKLQWSYQAQDSKVNSVQYVPTKEHLVVTAGAGQSGLISLHDIRKLSKSKGKTCDFLRSVKGHSKSINAAIVSPDGNYLVSVSQDNTIRLWTNFTSDAPDSQPQFTSIHHDNHTGRWLSTFRPVFDPKQECVFMIGSMSRPRTVDFFSIETTTNKPNPNLVRFAHLESNYLGSVCSRNAFHPFLNVVIGGNSSGRLHVFR